MAITFSAVLEQEGPGYFVYVPPEVARALGPAKRPAVRVVVNGVELRTTIAVYGGRAMIGLRRDIREAAEVAPGETIALAVELDTQERRVEVSDDLAAALATDPEARSAFERLSFTNRSEYVAWVESARRAETRQQRIAATPALLKSGRRTPL
jgi:hypothetical protein